MCIIIALTGYHHQAAEEEEEAGHKLYSLKTDQNYILNWSLPEQSFFSERARTTPLDRLHITDGMNILEVGCGSGGVIARIASTYPRVTITGIDSSQKAIDEAQRMADQQHLSNVRFIHADAHSLPFDAGEFDLCFFQTVLMHLRDPHEALAQMVNVTRSGGRITALAEGDWSHVGSQPACDALDGIITLFLQAMARRGGDPFIGGKLSFFFEQLDVIEIETFENMPREIITGKELLDNGYLAIASSFFDREHFTDLLSQVEDWCDNARGYLVMPASFGATAVKKH